MAHMIDAKMKRNISIVVVLALAFMAIPQTAAMLSGLMSISLGLSIGVWTGLLGLLIAYWVWKQQL